MRDGRELRGRRGQLLVELLAALVVLTLAGSALARQLVATRQLDDRRHTLAVATTMTRDASEQLAGDACHPDDRPRASGRVHLARTTSGSSQAPRQALLATLWPSALGRGAARSLTSVAAGWCP